MATAPNTVVFIHGLWMTPLSWEHWAARYRDRGFEVVAPAWPGVEGDIDQLRKDPTPLKGLGIADIVDHYDKVVRGLDRPPILMGHSFGGLFVKLLLDRGLGAAGVSIDGGPPKGIPLLPISTLRSARPVLGNPFNFGKATALTPKQFQYAFGNTLTRERSDEVRARYAIPAANRVLFQGGLANVSPGSPARIDWANSTRAPLLLLAGGKDHIVPVSLTSAIHAKYRKHSTAVTDIVVHAERSHFTVGEDGWEAVADHALDWAIEQTASDAAA
jgi:alpha-beta hydrolase superfamily lysophospholipase